MATIINKTAPTPLIPLANPSGVSIPSSAMAVIESAMAHPHIGTNKAASKKKGKKGKKQQKASKVAMHNNAVNIPVHDVEVVEAEIVEPVKEEVVLPEVKTSSVVIAHTEEKEATKAALPDERMMGLYADFEGIKNEILAAHKNGAILPEGFAKAVREVADVVDAVEKVDADRRGISIKKEVYDNYSEPTYNPRECTETTPSDIPFGDPSMIVFEMMLQDHHFKNGGFETYPDIDGRSLLKTVSDNRRYISDNEFIVSPAKYKGDYDMPVLLPSSPFATSGLVLYETRPDRSHTINSAKYHANFIIRIGIPKNLYSELVLTCATKIFVCYDAYESEIQDGTHYTDVEGNNALVVPFDNLCEIIKNPRVVKAGQTWGGLSEKFNYARPHGTMHDGNILIFSDRAYDKY